jgi:3-oxoacyl-[acyl-carrier-protein] synthase II
VPSLRRVAITGLGAITPLGNSVPELLERWCAGIVGLEGGRGTCTEFDPHDTMSIKEARRADRFTQFAIAATQQAVDQAGWNGGPPCAAERVGCFMGTGFGGFTTMEQQHEVARSRGLDAISPLAATSLMPNAAASSIAIRFGIHGPTHGVASACAAGADAIGSAARAIAVGDADVMIAGGAEAPLTELSIAATDKMGALSKVGVSRPFDARRDGFVMAEGAGAMVLEAADFAERRGARVLGEVAGYGATTDGYHLSAPDPEARGASGAIRRALEDAGVEPGELDYVNAHGTSTQLNDRTETNALKRVLGDAAYGVPVSSTKSVIGHLIGGAGAAECAVTVLALHARVVPPTVGLEEPDEGLDLDYVQGAARWLESWPSERHGRPVTALSNSFGFGGQNAVVCLRVDMRNGGAVA